MTDDKIQTIIDKFNEEKGIDLESSIADNGNDVNKASRFINKQFKIIVTYIKKNANMFFDYDKLDESRQEEFDEILLDQLEYTIENEDLSTWNGIDNGTVITNEDLMKKVIAPIVADELMANGFMARGIVW